MKTATGRSAPTKVPVRSACLQNLKLSNLFSVNLLPEKYWSFWYVKEEFDSNFNWIVTVVLSCKAATATWLLWAVSLGEKGSVVPMMYLNPNLSTGRIRLVSEEFPSWFIVTTDTGVVHSNRIYFFSIFISSVLNDFGKSTFETPRVMTLLRVNGRDWSFSGVALRVMLLSARAAT